ncbi:MAG: ABC transporter permease [Chloroflexi bacterium]|nr:ABC transporter permease [Chloroflexota bacterium]MCI0577382.1 ABC transporter permease [Chloroflexota bacterium]MCI0647069.1 ABC transporter permease [Chloroflexota bacterium]MCI0731556.1 ABC transporter permease [Chloroflexota bacterium]
METSTPLKIGSTGGRLARWQLILALVRKDLLNLARSPSMLLMMVLPLFLQLFFQVAFGDLSGVPVLPVALYDPAGSPVAALLAELPNVELQQVTSEAALAAAMEDAAAGIAVPADFAAALAGGERPELTVWLNSRPIWESELADFQQGLAEQVWELGGQQPPVRLSWTPVAGTAELPDDDSSAGAFLLTLLLMTGMAMNGLNVSLLVVEEKDERTLDALLLSPAGKAEFVISKGLTVFLYTLLITGVMFAISGQIGGAWPVTTASLLLGALFMVGSGLLLGSIFQTKNQCNAWGGLIMLVLIMPSWLAVWQPTQSWLVVLRVLPTYYLTDLLMMSLGQALVATRLLLDLALLLGSVLLVFFLTGRRLDRFPLGA